MPTNQNFEHFQIVCSKGMQKCSCMNVYDFQFQLLVNVINLIHLYIETRLGNLAFDCLKFLIQRQPFSTQRILNWHPVQTIKYTTSRGPDSAYLKVFFLLSFLQFDTPPHIVNFYVAPDSTTVSKMRKTILLKKTFKCASGSISFYHIIRKLP